MSAITGLESLILRVMRLILGWKEAYQRQLPVVRDDGSITTWIASVLTIFWHSFNDNSMVEKLTDDSFLTWVLVPSIGIECWTCPCDRRNEGKKN